MSRRFFSRGPLLCLGTILLVPVVVLYLTQVIWLESLSAPFPWLVSHPAAVGLFWVIFSSFCLTLYGFSRRVLPSYLPAAVVLLLLSHASWCKMKINGAPIQLSDFTLLGNIKDITGFAANQLLPSPPALAAAAITVLLFVFLGRMEKHWRLPPGPGLAIGGVAMALFFSLFYPGTLQSAAAALDEGCADQVERNDRAGVALGVYTAWATRQLAESGGNDADAAELAQRFLADAQAPGETLSLEEAPDIIFIVSESFFDVTRLPGLTFQEDPLPVFHALSETCTNGRFLSNTYGGGTGYVEMEMFTGLTSSLLREGDTLSTLDLTCYRNLPTTVRCLRQLGYDAVAVHSHDAKLYNRASIYPAIGFQEMLFQDDFLTQPERRGEFVSDESFARELIARYEARDPDVPFFLYGLSMENHQSYYPEKFGESSGYPAQCGQLSGQDLAILDSLVYGLHDADASLGILTDYFSQADRPVLLVFVGDHLPSLNLSDGVSIYTHLGVSPTEESSDWDPATLMDILSTDYLIWTNYETAAQPDRMESCTFLGLHTLQRAGLPLNDYFSWLAEEISPNMLLSRNRFFADGAGNAYYHIAPETQVMLDRYTAVERSLLYSQ